MEVDWPYCSRCCGAHFLKVLLLLLLFLLVHTPITSEDPEWSQRLALDLSIWKQHQRYVDIENLLRLKESVPEEYQYFFHNWSYSYDPLILVSIVEHESRWNEQAVGTINSNGSRDFGLAQLNSEYHDYFINKYWNREEPFDIMNGHHSLFIAAEHLEWLYGETNNEREMIMAYNIGIGSVRNGWRQRSGERYFSLVGRLTQK